MPASRRLRRSAGFLAALLAVSVTPGAHAQRAESRWTIVDAKALLAYVDGIGNEGLIPADYAPQTLRRAIENKEGAVLDAAADASLIALVEDLRDGRTPVDDRGAWYVDDDDEIRNPTDAVLARALRTHDISGTLASLDPTAPDYAALKEALAGTPAADTRRRALLRVNMDRWRWFPRDFGSDYLFVNVPEFRLRQVRGGDVVGNYRVIVGKPGDTATPILAEKAAAVVLNPVWTVPEPIAEGEGLGARLLAHPETARAGGYVVRRDAGGKISVIQQPGPANVLGKVKIDMPNAYGIYLHDTPAQDLFNRTVPALSHGCLRVEGAIALATDLAETKADMRPAAVRAIIGTGQTHNIGLSSPMPVFIGYFTIGPTSNRGSLGVFGDIYSWDAQVGASFQRPRVPR